jgi:3-dehydroquinate dehydratase-2
MKKFLSISGPNLNLLGTRKVSIYKGASLADIHEKLKNKASELGVKVDCVQFNSEGGLIKKSNRGVVGSDTLTARAGQGI